MRALGYFRTPEGVPDHGPFERAFRDYCRSHFHQPIETFGDIAENEETPGYNRMVDYMRAAGGGYLIVVPDAAHLGQDVESVVRKLVELEGLGAKVSCSDDDLPDPLQGALMNLGVKGVSRERSARARESMIGQALAGQGLGRTPYGYRIGEDRSLVVVPEEAEVVRSIFRLYTEERLGLRLIAQRLNEAGTPTRRRGRWSIIAIRDILRNPVYMGTYTRYGMRLPKSHEAIMAPEIFRTAQRETRERRPPVRPTVREPFLLSGLAYCAYCGNRMMGVTRRQTWKRKDGRRQGAVYRYYQCQSKKSMSVCDYHTWRASKLDETVVDELRRIVKSRRQTTPSVEKLTEVESTIAAERRNAERRLIRAARRAARGEIRTETLAEYVESLDAARGRTANDLLVNPEEALASWDSLDTEARRRVVAECVSRVVVRDDAVELVE